MRVLHLSSVYAPYAVGGAEKVVEMLAEGCVRDGVEAAVAYIAPEPLPTTLRNGVELRPLAHRNPLWIADSARHSGTMRKLNKVATLFNPLTLADFEKTLASYRPDVVHSHSMVEMTPRMWKAAKGAGAAVVHTLHDYDLMCIRAAMYKDGARCERPHRTCAAFSRVKRHYHTNIDHVVGVSSAVMQVHLDRGFFAGLPQAHRHVIWNPVRGVDAGGAPRVTPRSGPFTFGFLGRLVQEKGILDLIAACRQLPRGDWQLKIAGRAPDNDEFLRERIGDMPVKMMGFVDPAQFFAEIDVLVVPSVWDEPFGLTVVEAYAHGVPVIGSHIAGVREIIGAVDAGALFPAGDAAALAQRLGAAIQAGRQSWSPAGRLEVLARTAPDFVVARYREVYDLAVKSAH